MKQSGFPILRRSFWLPSPLEIPLEVFPLVNSKEQLRRSLIARSAIYCNNRGLALLYAAKKAGDHENQK
jgi:hypothetical protein